MDDLEKLCVSYNNIEGFIGICRPVLDHALEQAPVVGNYFQIRVDMTFNLTFVDER